MKKKTALLLTVLCMLALFTGCSSQKDFNIKGATKIELKSGTDGTTVEITDKESIDHITENINAIKFTKEKSSKDYTGWSYRLKWYDSENKLIEDIVIMTENRIDYKNYFYNSMKADDDIDIAYFDMLLSGSETVCVAVIEEIENETMIVRPTEGAVELSSSDKYAISTKYLSISREPQVGDTIEITYFGGILETYPARFANISSIKLATD